MVRFTFTLVNVLAAVGLFAGQGINAAPVMTNNGAIDLSKNASASSSSGKNATVTTKVDSLQCNIARATIITDLNELGLLLQDIDTSNETVATAVSQAQGGLKTSGDAITDILKALIGGEGPPAEGRQKTDAGLGVMLQALTGLNSTEPAVVTALNKLNDAIAAGSEVVTVCR
ncbi:hypothetical protein VNI00_016290 [Paramarasmius palmivorus]|uniref:Secreted protein n=1 Tax=Paramarasmius palmivorus TaxID=297713 RepID=A0AAW0BDP2_9AGAR